MEPIIFKELIIDQDNKLCSINGEAISLSKKEYELLIFLITNPNHVYSREDLIEELWDSSVTKRAVDTTISRLRNKLGKYGSYIVTRLGFGYCFNG